MEDDKLGVHAGFRDTSHSHLRNRHDHSRKDLEHTYNIQAVLWFMGPLAIFLSAAFMILSLACMIHARIKKNKA